MAFGPITSWQIDGEIMETVTNFIFLGSKITADGDCSHEIKRCLLLGRKAMTNLESILKSRDITLPTKSSQSYRFSSGHVWVREWTIKKAECWRIAAFEPWCWRRVLRVPWTARRSNQSILKEISPGCSLEGLILKLKLQHFGHWCEELTHWKGSWCWERLKAGGEVDNRGWDGWMASLTRWTWIWTSSRSWILTGRPGGLQSMGSQRIRHDWATELNWVMTSKNVARLFWKLAFTPNPGPLSVVPAEQITQGHQCGPGLLWRPQALLLKSMFCHHTRAESPTHRPA